MKKILLSFGLLALTRVVFAAASEDDVAGTAEYGRGRKGSSWDDMAVRQMWYDFDRNSVHAIDSLEQLISTLTKYLKDVPALENKKNDLKRQLTENQDTLDVNTAEIRESFEEMKKSVQIHAYRYHSDEAENEARAKAAREILKSGHSHVRLLQELANKIKSLKEENAALEEQNHLLNFEKENTDSRLQILYSYPARINMYSRVLELQKAERAE